MTRGLDRCVEMTLDLDENARILTRPDAGESLYSRAIRLFEFQISLFCPAELAASPKEIGWHVDGRLHAALRMIGYLEKKLANEAKKEALSLAELNQNSEYAQLFELFRKLGGWDGIRKLTPAKEFDEQIRIRRKEAQSVAKMVDFSYRFASSSRQTGAKGGITMARSIVQRANSYHYKKKLSTLKSRWREYGQTAGFHYLLQIQRFELAPPTVAKSSFAKMLLEQVEDVDHLSEFFRAYQHVCKVLEPLGYSFPRVGLDLGPLPESLPISPFPYDVEEAISTYRSA